MLHTSPRHLALTLITLSVMSVLPAIGQTINETRKFLPHDGAEGDRFGGFVAISDTTVVVGAFRDDDNGEDSGSVYLFDRTTGQQIAKLLPNDGAEFDLFGGFVAISETTVIVGVPWGYDNGIQSGSAYLFDATTGQQVAKLLPNDGVHGAGFGSSVVISGTTAVVAAMWDDENGDESGSVYLFDTTTGHQLAKLLPDDGGWSKIFGSSVAISGTTVVVGSVGDNNSGHRSGSAYLFDTTTGQQLAKLLPNDGEAEKYFGSSVAISGTTVVIGSVGDNDNGENSGSAYLFDTTTGQQIAKLLPNDGAQEDHFGHSVAIYGTTAVIGAPSSYHGSGIGSAYLFDITTGQQIAKLLPSDGASGDSFGSVAISGTTVVVGAQGDDDNGFYSGSAYVFTIPCPADLTGDGALDFFDVSAFLTAFWNQDPIADYEPDGNFNFFDVTAYLIAFGMGCP